MMQLAWKHNVEIILNQLTLLQLINSATVFFLCCRRNIHQNMILLVRSSTSMKYNEIEFFFHTARAETLLYN